MIYFFNMDTIQTLRQQIDELDKKLVELLGQRFALVAKIGVEKKKNNLPIVDEKRQEEKKIALRELATKNNVDITFVEKVWDVLFKEAHKIEQ